MRIIHNIQHGGEGKIDVGLGKVGWRGDVYTIMRGK